jgi:hypothetical protein
MAVTTRQGLIDYCRRALGEPVVDINIDDVQVEDRVDEALDYWNQYHFDGAERVYLKQKITASRLFLDGGDSADWTLNTVITGGTSGAKAKVCSEWGSTADANKIICKNVVGTFVAGETITGDNGATATLDDPLAFQLGTYDQKYFALPDAVYGVTRVIPFSSGSSSKNLFDLQYQLRLNDLYDLTSTSIIYYKQVMSHISLLNLELNGYPLYRFNRMQGQLRVDVNWDTAFAMGDFLVIEAYRALNPAEWSKVWNEPWLRHYVTALIKRQWATNGKKFQGMVLPGGVSIDFQGMYDESIKEIKELEDEMMNKSAPLEFFLG